jgi:hypothetical protein
MAEPPEDTLHPGDEGTEPVSGDMQARISLLRAAPGLARLSATAWWRTTRWAAGTYLRATSRMLRATLDGESPSTALQAATAEIRDRVRDSLEIVEAEEREPRGRAEDEGEEATIPMLRERGAELLRRSADVAYDEETHPAYARILDVLAPDEARILRLLALDGPQPAVDVRTGTLPINVGSELVAPGLTMIGAEAGCRNTDSVPSYLNNLYRLGLIWFSRESLADPSRYQVLEAQPEVVEAMEHAGRARTVRRSIHLTPFGHDFCRTCLPLDETGERSSEDSPQEREKLEEDSSQGR